MRNARVLALYASAVVSILAACVSNSSSPVSPDVNAGLNLDGSLDAFSPADAAPDATAPDGSIDASRQDTGAADANGADTGAPEASTDASDATTVDAGLGGVRVANLVADGLPIDFCIVPSGQSFSGATPYMAGVGVSSGLAYAEVSEYAATPSEGAYVVRLVAAGASTCAAPLSGVSDTTTPTVTALNPVTVTLLGASGDAAALSAQALVDDGVSTSPVSGLRLRIFHAAPLEPQTAFEFGAGPTWTFGLFASLSYGQAPSTGSLATGAPTTDAQGYFTSAIGDAQVTATRVGNDLTSGYDGYSTASLFFVGNAASLTSPLGMLTCNDALASGHLGACTLHTGAPTFHDIRWLHLAPDAPAVDACLRMSPIGPYVNVTAGAGITSGLAYLKMTGPIATFPDQTSFDTFFEAQGGNCSSSLGADTGSSLGTYATVALTESAFPPGAPPGYALTMTFGEAPDPTAGTSASVSMADDDVAPGAEAIDVNGEEPDGGSAVFATGLTTGNTDLEAHVNAGSYTVTASNDADGGVLATEIGVPLGAGTTTVFHFYDVSSTGRAFAVCDLADPATPATLVACK